MKWLLKTFNRMTYLRLSRGEKWQFLCWFTTQTEAKIDDSGDRKGLACVVLLAMVQTGRSQWTAFVRSEIFLADRLLIYESPTCQTFTYSEKIPSSRLCCDSVAWATESQQSLGDGLPEFRTQTSICFMFG